MTVTGHTTNRQIIRTSTLAELIAEAAIHCPMWGFVDDVGDGSCAFYSCAPAAKYTVASPYVVASTGNVAFQWVQVTAALLLANSSRQGAVPAISAANTVLGSADGIVESWVKVSTGMVDAAVAPPWHSTTPSAADHYPIQILAGSYIGLAWDSGASTMTVSVNQSIAEWHITGGADVIPNRVDTGAGLLVTSDGTGGVILSTNGVKFVNDDELYSVTDGSGYRHSELTTRGIVQLTNNATIDIVQVTETLAGMLGSIHSADYPNLDVFVELELSGEGLIPGTVPTMGTRVDRAVYYMHLISTFYSTPWVQTIGIYENTSLRSPVFVTDEIHSWGTISAVLSGTNYGTWTIKATTNDWSTYTFKWPSVAYKLRILGEGRFVVA